MSAEITTDRDLTPAEHALVQWLLEHGTDSAKPMLNQLAKARVSSHCGCGCASIGFAVDGVAPDRSLPMEVVSDFEWRDTEGMFGAIVFGRQGRLSGCDLLSV